MRRVEVALHWGPGDDLAVGTLAEVERGRVFFEYAESFLATGLEISPWKLPLRRDLIEHTERSFGPLFGVFDDSLPDGWGLLLMDRYFRLTRRDPRTVSALDRLLYLGTGTMGALTYQPASEPPATNAELDLTQLAEEATRVLQGSDVDVLPELRRAGGSPAGARPKVVVGVRGDDVISGVEDVPEGWEHWLIKFPGARDGDDDGSLEYAYMRMAERAGVDVPDHRLFAGRFFGVKRFDRSASNRRHHMHTLGGLVHSNFREPAGDYDLLLRVARGLARDQRDVIEGVRRMAFNVVAHNRDDHVKNFAFIMRADGAWRMSPAYDLSYSGGPGGEHTMTIDGEGRQPTLEGILEVAIRHGVSRAKALEIIQRVEDAVADWRAIATEAGCRRDRISAIAKAHRFLRPRTSRGGKKRRKRS